MKMINNLFRQNIYTISGLLIGILFGNILAFFFKDTCSTTTLPEPVENDLLSDKYVAKVNLAAKPLKAQKNPQTLLRPRYFSTELGIRKKLFVAVLTSQQTINTRGIAVNKTTSHLVDKLTFFIDAPGSKKLNVSYLKLPGIVGFIDTRMILKPFHVLKYIKDNYIENYDFFFIVNDNAYIKARKLNEIVQKISVSERVYASTKITDSLFCSLDAGILFSNSLIQSMIKNIDWCVKHVFSSSDTDNFGRCALHSANLPCQQKVQENQFTSYHLEDEQVLNASTLKSEEMNQALTVYPMKDERSFYTLHTYFSKIDLESTKLEISSVRKSIVGMVEHTPIGAKSVTWPIGNRPGNEPINRFDIIRWDYLTQTHIYFSSDFENVRRLNEAEQQDIKNLLNATIEMIHTKYEGSLQFKSLLNCYRKFDPSRGMDYIVDISFQNVVTHKITNKRIEVCKPLGKVELLTVPYVTENRRVNMILPVRTNDKDLVKDFLKRYREICLQKKEKTFLMMVFIYEYNAPGKGTKDDVFKDLKNEALQLTKMYQRDDNRVAWLSIKLPFSSSRAVEEVLLDFAVVDLSIKKFSTDSLILFTSAEMEFKPEYLNRVRMNTILNSQIFSPIPFSEYNPYLFNSSNIEKSHRIEIVKRQGHFDALNTRHISFYANDYLTTRKKTEHVIPPIRSDADITRLQTNSLTNKDAIGLATNTLYAMFVRFGDAHVIRGAEPALVMRHRPRDCDQLRDVTTLWRDCVARRNINLGARGQIAAALERQNSS